MVPRTIPYMLVVVTTTVRAEVSPGQSSEPFRADYQAVSDCPDQDQFVARILARTPRARCAEAAETARTFVVRISHTGAQFRGSLAVVEPLGVTESRQVTGASCAEVLDALALVAALSIDPSSDQAAPPFPLPETRDGGLPTSRASSTAARGGAGDTGASRAAVEPFSPAPDTAHGRAAGLPALDLAPAPRVAHRVGWVLGFSIDWIGAGPGLLLVPSLFVGVGPAERGPWLRLAVGGGKSHEDYEIGPASSASASFTYYRARMEGCLPFGPWGAVRLSPCAGVEAALLEAQLERPPAWVEPSDEPGSAVWVQLVALGRVDWRVAPWAELGAMVGASVPVRTPYFYVKEAQGGEREIDRVSAGLLVGLETGILFP